VYASVGTPGYEPGPAAGEEGSIAAVRLQKIHRTHDVNEIQEKTQGTRDRNVVVICMY